MCCPRRPGDNPAEGVIREIKMNWYMLQIKKNVPNRLLYNGRSYICKTGYIIPTSSKYSKGRTPSKCISGKTPEISECIDFDFYDWVVFRSNTGLGKAEICHCLGVSHRVHQLIYWMLLLSGIPISCITVQ